MDFFLENISAQMAVLVVLALYLYAMQTVRLRHTKKRISSLEIDVKILSKDLYAFFSGSVGVSKRLGRLEKKAKIQNERQDNLELKETNMQVYDQATRLVQKGAGLNELVNTCGLSRGEAELIVFLNGDHSEELAH